jgi:hypothetical protein
MQPHARRFNLSCACGQCRFRSAGSRRCDRRISQLRVAQCMILLTRGLCQSGPHVHTRGRFLQALPSANTWAVKPMMPTCGQPFVLATSDQSGRQTGTYVQAQNFTGTHNMTQHAYTTGWQPHLCRALHMVKIPTVSFRHDTRSPSPTRRRTCRQCNPQTLVNNRPSLTDELS